jgi:hypothetical protein
MKRINKITIKRVPDYDCDLSWIGTFSNTAESDLAIKHEGGRNSFEWFNPQPGACENKGQAQRDYDRMIAYDNGEWSMLGIKAEAETVIEIGGGNWKLDTITSGGLWGLESDSDEKYLKEIEAEQLAELKGYLKEYGFTDGDIKNAPIIE